MFSPFLSFLGKRKEPSEDEVSSSDEETQDADPAVQPPQPESEDEAFQPDETPEMSANDEFDKSTATMAQLLTAIIPDADIHCSNVVIIGGQSSGKTKMIISMVFHHLIENPSVTDLMGEKLLKLFRTGEKMVTRRPTRIRFMKKEPGSACQITLQFRGESANFDEPKFDQIVEDIHNESLVRDGKAFRDELRVIIAAPGLPNMFFTDLPGLITDDRKLHGDDDMTIRKLVKGYVRQPRTTLVVVEPAATEDFDTSQVAPMLK
jgi:hypothetical protein